MRLYNTLTRTIDEILPLNAPKVTVYTCGPTVYDYAHIGHWFNYVRMDTLIRTLKSTGLEPLWVMNITDVGHLVSDADDGEDKLEKGAKREGKTAWEVAEQYTADFMECWSLLGNTMPHELTKATEHIAEQIALIVTLEQKGYTYTISDGVYYDTSKFEGYAAFARLDLEDQEASGRVAFNPEKRNQSDFALWKFSPKEGTRDMEWESPWGTGFPGWHIECSAMSMKYLGDTLDIHTGGIDHIPVHHTNEIAQSEAVTGKRFATYWMHGNHIMIDGEKVSKSLGNGIRLQDLLKQGSSVEAIRLLILESHYRRQSKFSQATLTAAQNRLQGYQAMADLKWQATPQGVSEDIIASAKKEIMNAMLQDLSSSEALAVLSKFEQLVLTSGLASESREAFQDLLSTLDDLFGLNLSRRQDITQDQQSLLKERLEARQNKDWDRADSLRTNLQEQGIEVRDITDGQVWTRIA